MTLEQYIRGLEFDLNHYKELYSICDNAIKTGDWDGYSEGLKIRKLNLKIYADKIQSIEEKINTMKWDVFEEKYPLSYKEIQDYLGKYDVSKLNDDDLMHGFLKQKGVESYGLWIRGLKNYEEKLRMQQNKPNQPTDNQLSMF